MPNISESILTLSGMEYYEGKNKDRLDSGLAKKAEKAHTHIKSEVGLNNVDNTSDINKPVSTAQRKAIDDAYTNSNAYTDQKIVELINGAPETMDTLKELSDAINENKNVESALNEAIGKKANQTELDTHTGNTTIHITASERTNWNKAKTHADSTHARTDATKTEKSNTNGNIKINGTETIVYTHPGSGTNPHGTTKSDVGLGNVDNTADVNKSVKHAKSADSATNASKVNNHTVESNVPANAKFTDTTYSNFVKSGSGAKNGLVPAPSTTAGTTKYLREDGTWQTPPNTNTWIAFKGATSSADGTAGYVPAPAKGQQTKFFRADGTWQTVSAGGNKTAYQKTEPTGQSNNDEWLKEY